MRARYTAYTLGNAAFVLDTTHPDSPHFEADRIGWARSVAAFSAATHFLGLEVQEALAVDGAAQEGFVSFVAHIEQGGKRGTITERSRFVRAGGRWWYVADAG